MENFPELAFNIINNLLRIKKDNVISISGEIYNSQNSPQQLLEIPIIEELAIAIRKKEAFPILELSTTNLRDRFFNEMPKNIYSLPPSYYIKQIEIIDAFIEIGWQKFSSDSLESESIQSKEMAKSTNDLKIKIYEDNKKILFLNYPNYELAKYLNIDFKKLLVKYSDAVNCNYQYLQKTGVILKEKYFSSANYKIENLTNVLEFKIKKDAAILNSGDQNETQFIILPAGFIEFPLIRTNLNGIIVFERAYYRQHLFEDVKILFENGKIRYLIFKVERKENFFIRNALMSSINECSISLGYNPEIKSYSNFSIYDRCIDENITFTFICEDKSEIFLTTKKVKIEKLT